MATNGYKIKVGTTDVETVGIDTPDDLKRAEEYLLSTNNSLCCCISNTKTVVRSLSYNPNYITAGTCYHKLSAFSNKVFLQSVRKSLTNFVPRIPKGTNLSPTVTVRNVNGNTTLSASRHTHFYSCL